MPVKRIIVLKATKNPFAANYLKPSESKVSKRKPFSKPNAQASLDYERVLRPFCGVLCIADSPQRRHRLCSRERFFERRPNLLKSSKSTRLNLGQPIIWQAMQLSFAVLLGRITRFQSLNQSDPM